MIKGRSHKGGAEGQQSRAEDIKAGLRPIDRDIDIDIEEEEAEGQQSRAEDIKEGLRVSNRGQKS